MAPKLNRRAQPSSFRPSAKTLSAFQMPREHSEKPVPQFTDGNPQPLNATYSAECRAFSQPLPAAPLPGRKEVRPSSGRFWASFAKAAKAKVPLPQKKPWSPKAPPPPRLRKSPKPPSDRAPPLQPPTTATLSLADAGKQIFTTEMLDIALPIADVTAELGLSSSVTMDIGFTAPVDGPYRNLNPSSPSYFDRATHERRKAGRAPFRRQLPLFGDVRDSSLGTLNSDVSSILGARNSMNPTLSPRDSRNWDLGGSDPELKACGHLAFPTNFQWDVALSQGGRNDEGDGMDVE